MIRLFPPSPRDIEALRAQEAARRRADDPNITSRSGFGRPQIRPLSAQERHQQREDARAERSFQQRQQRQQARAQQTQQAVTDYRAGEREQRPPTPVEQYRTGERDSFVAPLAPVVTEANQLPVSMPGEDDASWNNWLISEKWGNELSTDQAVSLFLGYVTGNYDIEADDVATLQALEVIVRETVGDVIDTNSALYLLQQSGALDGRGFSAYTLDYLINQSSIVMGSGQTIPPEVIEAIVSANLGILSAEELAHLEALTGLTTEQANLVRNEAAWVQSTLVNELYAMVSAGLLSEDIVPYLNQDLDNRSNVNLGILVALYQEGLEKAGSNSPYLHQPGTELPVMFFASQHNNLYPEGTPYGEHLLIAMSFFPVLDQVAAAIDFIRSVAAGDRLGAALALMSFLPGPNLGAFDDIVEGVARNADEIVEGVARNADEVVDEARHVPVPTAVIPPVQPGGNRAFTPTRGGRRSSTITLDTGDNVQVFFNTQHSFDRPHDIPSAPGVNQATGQTSAFSRTNLRRDQVESAILDDLTQQINSGVSLPTASQSGQLVDSAGNIVDNFVGTIIVDGYQIEYHAIRLANGQIHVSTYALTQPN